MTARGSPGWHQIAPSRRESKPIHGSADPTNRPGAPSSKGSPEARIGTEPLLSDIGDGPPVHTATSGRVGADRTRGSGGFQSGLEPRRPTAQPIRAPANGSNTASPYLRWNLCLMRPISGSTTALPRPPRTGRGPPRSSEAGPTRTAAAPSPTAAGNPASARSLLASPRRSPTR